MIYLGIDIAKRKFDVALLENDKYKCHEFSNDTAGFVKLHDWLKPIDIFLLHVCMESTGTYSQKLAYFLVEQGIKVSVVNPIQTKGFAQNVLRRNKTDQLDAKLIAQFCQAIKPNRWKPLSTSVTALQALVRRLDDLQQLYLQEQNRLESADKTIIVSIEAILEVLQAQMKHIQQQIEAHIKTANDLKEKSQLLKTIPGIGERTTAKLLAYCSDATKFESAKQLATYAGLNPIHRQSGSSVKGKPRLSKTGNAEIRHALYMPALVAIKHNPIIKAFYNRLMERGKPKMVIVGAVMRKLLHIIYGVLKSGNPFNVEFELAS